MSERRLRVLLVDDEPLALERLQLLCATLEGIDLAGTAADGAAALRLIDSLNPDLVLLDISMPGLDGMEVARTLAPHSPAIIFVTAHEEFALPAFDIGAVDYLLKPVAPDRLARAVERARQRGPHQPQAATRYTEEFWVPHRGELVRIAAAAIDLIEAERDYMRLHVGTRSFLLHATIASLESRLDPDKFLRIHRSIILPRARIARLRHAGDGQWCAVLTGGAEHRIGRTYLDKVRAIAGR